MNASSAFRQLVSDYVAGSTTALRQHDLLTLLSPSRAISVIWGIWYILIQCIIIALFKPPPPPKEISNPRGRIAIIGAGVTGVSSAAHAVAHGFEVVLFEQAPADKLGGIWAQVNETSGLQLNSLLYRFHPAVLWTHAFPNRDEVLTQIRHVWEEYHLDTRTRFDTKVTSVRRVSVPEDEEEGSSLATRGRSRWIINDEEEHPFDAIIVTVGTCGAPNWIELPGMPKQDDGKRKKERKGDENEKQRHQGHEEDPESSGQDAPQSSTPSETDEGADLVDSGVSYANVVKEGEVSNPQPEGNARQMESNASYVDVLNYGESAVVEGLRKDIGGEEKVDNADRANKKETQVKESAKKEEDKEKETETYKGKILHSSQLDDPDFELEAGARVVVIGSGASGVEAVETVLQRFGSAADHDEGEENKDGKSRRGVVLSMVARDDKWIIPRNIVVDTAIAGQPFGRQMPLSFLWETVIKYWQYPGVEALVPSGKGIYEGTPVVNDVFLEHIRKRRCQYIRGQPVRLTKTGVIVEARKGKNKAKAGSSKKKAQNSKKSGHQKNKGALIEDVGTGEERVLDADVIVFATGYKKPSLDFLPGELFPEGYERPDLYLQNFSTEDWSVLMTNTAYLNAIGTVGHFHIGIYTRILLTLLLDENARPTPKDMKLWVDVLRYIKRGATGGALGFFTYMELTIWLVLFHLFRLDRLQWLFFIMNGWGVYAATTLGGQLR